MAGNNLKANKVNSSATLETANKNSSLRSLITLERTQKLDLLTHLITNLRQSLVLCGPEGIGKSTLLEVLKDNKPESWLLCSIVATKQTSFEQVQTELLRLFNDININTHDLQECLQQLQKVSKKIVLIIDNAGQVVPGLISALCQFSVVSAHLRIIFALTPDELHVKKTSDKIIEDCHFIDLPALSEKQCGEFLQNLSTKPEATLSFEAISAAMIDKIYRETHGIPGKIVNIQMGVTSIKKATSMIWLYTLAFSIIIAAGISVLLQSNEQEQFLRSDVSALSTKKSLRVEISPPVLHQIAEIPGQETDQPEQQNNTQVIAAVHPQKPEGMSSIPLPITDSHQNNTQPEVIAEIEALGDEELSQIEAEQAVPEPTAAVEPRVPNKLIVLDEKEKIIESAIELKQIVVEKPIAVGAASKKPEKLVKQSEQINQKVEVSEQNPISTQTRKVEEKKKIAVDEMRDGIQWILDQPQKNYTLQLMSVEKKQTLAKVINRHKNLQKNNFHVYQSLKKGQVRFVLLYGSFSNLKQASKASNTLPTALKPPWTRRFRILQKEVRASLPKNN